VVTTSGRARRPWTSSSSQPGGARWPQRTTVAAGRKGAALQAEPHSRSARATRAPRRFVTTLATTSSGRPPGRGQGRATDAPGGGGRQPSIRQGRARAGPSGPSTIISTALTCGCWTRSS